MVQYYKIGTYEYTQYYLSDRQDRFTLYPENMIVFPDLVSKQMRIISDGKILTEEEFNWRLEHAEEMYMLKCL